MFKILDDAEGMGVVIESAVVRHCFVEGGLAGVAEGRVAQVVGERDRLGERFIGTQGGGEAPRDLGCFQCVRQPGSEMVMQRRREHLRLVFESSESRALDDTMAVKLERTSQRIGRFGVGACVDGTHRIPSQRIIAFAHRIMF